jgi:hypothetical protein
MSRARQHIVFADDFGAFTAAGARVAVAVVEPWGDPP